MILYNDVDEYCCQWMRNLIAAGHLPIGDVVSTSVVELNVAQKYTQLHTFAGVGTWARAISDAGVSPEVNIWSGSAPCQSFSTAGRKKGFNDARHLWPAFFSLIRSGRPAIVVGEQVQSPDALRWLDLVQSDLEGEGYSFRAIGACAAGVGAPHLRQRLYWVAVANGERLERQRVLLRGWKSREALAETRGRGASHGVGHPSSSGTGWDPGSISCSQESSPGGRYQYWRVPNESVPSGAVRGIWSHDVEWIACGDGRVRPAQRGSFPLDDGTSSGVGRVRSNRNARLKGYGNGIVLELATVFIEAVIGSILEPSA